MGSPKGSPSFFVPKFNCYKQSQRGVLKVIASLPIYELRNKTNTQKGTDMKHIKSLFVALAIAVPAVQASAASAFDSPLISNAVVSQEADAQIYLANSSLYKKHVFKHKLRSSKFKHYKYSPKYHGKPKAKFSKKHFSPKAKFHKKAFIFK